MAQDMNQTKGTILVIDDEPIITGVVETVLKREGYEVLVAHSGEVGLEKAKGSSPDLIFLDITLPGMDGYEIAEKLGDDPDLKQIPVIFLTGKSAAEDGGRAFEKGGISFVRKPFKGQQIRDLVNLTMMSLKD